MFRGRFFHTIDPKGRVSIPAKFRDALESDYSEKRLGIVPNEDCLEVHPLKGPAAQTFPRLYISNAQDAALDGQGRIQIPPDYRARAGLIKDVVLVGGVRSFGIWNRARWEEYARTNEPELPSLFEKISNRGV